MERPAGFEADPHERSLREHDVAVPGRVSIALAVADEHDPSAGRSMRQDPVPLARPADEAMRVPVGIRDRRPTATERGPSRDDRQVRHAQRDHRRLDEEAEPVRHDLDRDAGGLRARRKRGEPGVVGLGGGRGEQVRRIGIDHRHLERHEVARPERAGVVGGHLGLPLAGDVLGHDRVRHIGQGDRPVVVDEDGQGRLAVLERRDGRRDPRLRLGRHRRAAAGRRDAIRVSATPPTMIAPPTTWPIRMGSPRKM